MYINTIWRATQMTEQQIVFEKGAYWVRRAAKGFEVYKVGVTHSRRCAIIGFEGQKGIDRAKAEIDRRIRDDAYLASIPNNSREG
jgi:hypothetical protein